MQKSTIGSGLGNHVFAFVVTAALAAAPIPAFANEPHAFDISASDVSTAVREFGKQAGVEILASAELLQGKTFRSINGKYSTDNALNLMLAGTGLVPEYVGERGVVLVAVKGEKDEAGNEDDNSQVLDTTWLNKLQLAQADTSSADTAQIEAPESKLSTSQAGSGGLEEIVVTAQRREERLLDTPISISVLSGKELDQGTQRALSEVLNQVGGVAITEAQPGRTVITIRGVATVGFSSTAAFYMDEVPFALPRIAELPDVNAYDLSRVEVLRGPQGTLYGASSLSGAVRIIPNHADVDDFEFKGRTRFSNTDGSHDPNYGADFALNLPVLPGTLGIRAVAGYSKYGGFINSNFDGTRDINDNESQNYRLSATWVPVSDLEVRPGFSRSELNSNATSLSLDNYSTFTSADQPGERTLDIYSLVAEYDLGNVSLLSSTGYIDYSAADIRDRSAGTRILRFRNVEDTNQLSQEFRLVSELDGPWQWSLGAFYLKADWSQTQDARPFPSLPGVGIEEITNKSYAAFGELTRSFADGLFDITGGLRYYTAEETLRDLGSLTNAPLIGTKNARFKRLTGRMVLNYHPSDDVLLYGSVGTGFRNGEIQGAAALTADPTLPSADPDNLINYEIGNKAQLDLGGLGKLAYDVAVYYLDWRDIQQGISVSTPAFPAGFGGRANAGRASGFGVDAGFTYNPDDVVSIWTSVGWNDLAFDETVTSFVNGAPRVLFAEGERPNDSPEWTVAAGLNIRTPTGMNGIDVTASGDISYGSRRAARGLSGATRTLDYSDPITRANFGVGLASDTWTAELFVNNAFDEDGAVSPRQINGRLEAERSRPRTIGIQFTYNY